ncbi:MAG: Na+/H+ antiporter subunit E [Defluviitaleaceae bacterium]|nr:Na+/H+ antiporter subunit E [Defluviitaleaceae bacterium]
MGKHTFFVLLALTVVWIILMEEISWRVLGMGMLTVIACMHLGSKFLPYDEIKNVNFFKLATYPLFLVGQIYAAGFQVIKVILLGCRVDVVKMKTRLNNETLRIILADSITLIPGSVLLELDGEDVTVLWITSSKAPVLDAAGTDELIKGKLERRLAVAQRDEQPKTDEYE